MGGNLLAESFVGTITIGTPAARVNTDNFTGNITILDNHPAITALTLLNLFGSIVGGTLNIFGNVGTINVFRSLDASTSNLVIHGNLGNITVGSDLSHNNYSLTGTLTVEGNLGTATVNGALNGLLLVKGNATSVNVVSTRHGDIINSAGGVEVEGTINNFGAFGGNVAGNIVGTRGITHATISGGSLSGRLTSTLGSVSNVNITGNLSGTLSAANGTITALNLGGALTGHLEASTLASLSIPGKISGTINVVNGITAIAIGSLLASGVIQAGWISNLSISGNDLGSVTAGPGMGTPTLFTVGGNLSGKANFSTPLSAHISGNITATGSLTTTSSLMGLVVSGAIRGDVLVDGQIGSITASAIANGVITGGFGINAINAPGGITSSIIQAGISPGDDGVFGGNDVNETPTMADIGTITSGDIRNSIIAAGGNINTLRTTGTMTSSSASSGLVLASSSITAVMADTSPLANTTELNAARANATLLHGNFTNAIIGGTGLVNSALTAGVSPGADGVFDSGRNPNSDDNVSSSLTGGMSSFGTVSTVVDSHSVVLASSGGGQGTTQRVLHYTLDSNPITSIVPNDPVTGSAVATATLGSPGTFSLNGQTITVTILSGGPDATVSMFDNTATANVLDTLVINGGSTGKPVSVSVTTTAVGVLDLGRVLANDGTVVTSFSYNGYLVGDGSTDPQLWINNDMDTFHVQGGFGTNGAVATTWSGVIGGNVTKFFAGTQGAGKLRIGGTITNATIGTSVGDPSTVTLGHVNPAQAGSISQIALDPTTNTTYAYSGGFIFPVNINSGTILHQSAGVHTAFTNQPLTVNGMDFDGTGKLYGVSTLYNQSPTVAVGALSTGDNLHGLAVSSTGQIFAVNTNAAGVDQLVSIDPTTGALSTVGTLNDPFAHTFNTNFLALTFGPGDILYGITNDVDGTGLQGTGATAGMTLVQIGTTAVSGIVNVTNPSDSGSASGAPGVLIKLGGNNVTDPYDALVYGGTVAGNPFFWAVRRVGNVDTLDKISLTNFASPSTLTATAVPVGNILANNGTTVTHIVGMGFNESHQLIGMDLNGGGTSDLVGINTTAPGTSIYVSAPGSISNNLSAFAFGPQDPNVPSFFQTFGYNTNATTGGTFYANPGMVATLGSIVPATGTFTQIRALSQNAQGTPLAGNIDSVAVTKSGAADIFAVTSTGVLAEYDQFGNLVTGQPLGPVIDSVTGEQLSISSLSFDNAGHLIGIDSSRNRLVTISTTSTTRTINGQAVKVVIASQLTGTGTVNAATIVDLEFIPSAGFFVGFDGTNSNFVQLLGTSPTAVGGMTANSITTLNITSPFYGGRIVATGTTGPSGTVGFGTVNANGGGTFTGALITPASIGSFTRSGDFGGTLDVNGNATSIRINGSVVLGGVIEVDGTASTVVITGGLSGSVILGRAGSITIGAVAPTGVLDVRRDASGITINQFAAGRISVNSVNSLRVGGQLLNGANVVVLGDAGSLTFNGGEAVGALVSARGNVGNLTANGTISGTIAVRRNVTTATFNAGLNNGIFAVGGDINSILARGAVTRSIISSGVWIGNDGVYNTADDVIYGGSILSAHFNGIFDNSALLAGVLPRLGTPVNGANNIPANNTAYLLNLSNPNIADVDSAQAGGLQASRIGTGAGTVVFPGGVNPGSVVVAADGISGTPPSSASSNASSTTPPASSPSSASAASTPMKSTSASASSSTPAPSIPRTSSSPTSTATPSPASASSTSPRTSAAAWSRASSEFSATPPSPPPSPSASPTSLTAPERAPLSTTSTRTASSPATPSPRRSPPSPPSSDAHPPSTTLSRPLLKTAAVFFPFTDSLTHPFTDLPAPHLRAILPQCSIQEEPNDHHHPPPRQLRHHRPSPLLRRQRLRLDHRRTHLLRDPRRLHRRRL